MEAEARELATAQFIIRNTSSLRRFCAQAAAEGRIALDVEFIREQSYTPKLALVQVATRTACAIADPLAIADLRPLADLLASRQVLKVLHAAAQDLEILVWHLHTLPVHIFDTQLAAALAGLGEQMPYHHLVARLLGVSLPKTEGYSDWLQRPLTSAQIAYALDDVRYLLPLHTLLCARLRALNRLAWAAEEFRKFDDPARYHRKPRELFRRIRRSRTLSAKGLAILRELAAWRDQEAQRRDRPPGSVVRDEVLVELARKAPRTLADLSRLRGLPRQEAERSGPALLEAVARGLAVAEEDRPTPSGPLRLSSSEELTIRFLDACLRALCKREKLPPSLVATRAELEALVRQQRRGKLVPAEHPLLRGWRFTLVGRELLAVLEGRQSVYLDPATGQLTFTPRHS